MMKFIIRYWPKETLNHFQLYLFIIFVVLVTLVPLSLDSQVFADTASQIQNDINARLAANPHTGDKAILFVYSNTNWSGSMEDSALSSATRDGNGNSDIVFECSGSNGIYSIVMQKQTEGGYLALAVVQNGKLLSSKATGASYGVVSVAGNCEPDFSGSPILGMVAIVLLVVAVTMLIRRYQNKRARRNTPA